MYGNGKKKAIDVLGKGDWNMLDVFKQSNASADEIARVGELLLLKLYNAKQSVTALDKLMYVQYIQNISKTSSTFQLQILPPTSAAANGMLTIILTDRPIAPEQVLLIISCGCKTVCGKICKYRKAGIDCTPMCSICAGETCTNSCSLDGEDTEQ